MSHSHHSISVHFARTLLASAEKNGAERAELLACSGLNDQLLNNPELRITPEQFSKLMKQVWLALDDEFLGMGKQPSRHGVFTLMAKQAVHRTDLRSVYNHLCNFYNLVSDGLQLELKIIENQAHVQMTLSNSDRDPDCTLREFLLLLWHRFPSWLIGRQIPLTQVNLDFPKPAHYNEHKLMYPCKTLYSQASNSLIFDADILNEAVIQTPQNLREYLRRAPLDWFKRQAYFPIYTRRVMDYLGKTEQLGETNMEQIADLLHLTSRTLRRKLLDEGTSFQALKDEVRRDAAIHYLSQPTVPISTISRLLGFSEPAAFTRAFKQWTGVPPGLYRRCD